MTMLYLVTFDGCPDYVEADSFPDAIDVWRANLIGENPPDSFEADVQPESVELLHEEPVIRAAPSLRIVDTGATEIPLGPKAPPCPACAKEGVCNEHMPF
jgi:hypothetical protein